MKRFLLVMSIIFLFCEINAQPNKSSIDNLVITPFVASNTAVPEYAKSVLLDKLQQVVTANGLGGTNYDQRFVVTINVLETQKEVTTTIPPQYVVSMSPTLYIGDLSTGALFSSCSLAEIKGIGKSDNLAYMSAIKQINQNSPQIKEAVKQGKEKIMYYYDTQIDNIIKNAKALTSSDRFDDAILMLLEVPSVSTVAYSKAMDAIGDIYQQKIDKESAEALTKATAIWNATLSYDGAIEAAEWLSKVHPSSSSVSGAKKLTLTISARIKEIDTREWNYIVKEQQYNHEETMAEINAIKEIGVAYAKRPVYNTIVYWW